MTTRSPTPQGYPDKQSLRDSAAVRLLKKGDISEVTIESLAFGGEGIARVVEDAQVGGVASKKSLVVFVEDVVPGDKVEVRIGVKKRNFARGFVQKILQPSSDRIAPRCRHFGPAFEGGCGGCIWQFMDAGVQRRIKEQQVRDALTRIGGFSGDFVLPIVGGEPWYYRNKMEFSFGRDKDGKLGLGLHVRRRHHDVIEMTECFLLEPWVGDLVQFVREFFQGRSVDPELTLKSFTVRVGKNTGEVMMMISAENGQENFMKDFQEVLLKFCGESKIPLTSLYFLHIKNHKGQRTTCEEKLLNGAPTIQEKLKLPDGRELKFEISPQAFFQPNTKMAELLYAKTLEAAQLTGKETVFDLYCGTGTIGLFCASRAAKVYGVELNASAVENARTNAALNGITNAEFLVGDVEKILPTIKQAPEVVLVDPPRNGLAPKVVESVAQFGPQRIVYVSCNPTSLARDAALFLKTGYKLVSVQPVDQFPQTYHIENVALFIAIS